MTLTSDPAARAARDHMHPSAAHRAAEKLGDLRALDGVDAALADRVRDVLGTPARKQALRGDWLGHHLHPLMTDAVVGTWTSAALLDLTGSDRAAARRLIGAGLLATLPTVLTGLSEFEDSTPRDRRIAFVHGAVNGAASLMNIASWLARGRGDHARGRRLSLAALGVASVSAFLGGHLSFARGTGVDTTSATHPSVVANGLRSVPSR